MRRNEFGSRKYAVLYVRVDAQVLGRVKQIADRPPSGGEPESLSRLVGRVLGRFVDLNVEEWSADELEKAPGRKGGDCIAADEDGACSASTESSAEASSVQEAGVRTAAVSELRVA